MSERETLQAKRCQACEGGVPPLPDDRVRQVLAELPGWELHGNAIQGIFRFKDYYETMAFVNATAWVSHLENHHPDLEVGYNKCVVRYTTHAIGGLSENDLICAAKVDALTRLK